jgi:hypothetical protein
MEKTTVKLKGKATEKQKTYLEKLGIKFRKNITKQHASDLIKSEKSRKMAAHSCHVNLLEEETGIDYYENMSGMCPNGMF